MFKTETKAARPIFHAAGGEPARIEPLSADAFNRRFVAPVSASALPQPKRFASRLLAAAQSNDVHSLFTLRQGDAAVAMQEARAFRLPKPAAAPASEVVVALAKPDELPGMLDVGPTPAPDRKPERGAKADPRSAGKPRQKPAEAQAEENDKARVLRPGRTAKSPTVVASLGSKPDAPAKPRTLWQALGFARPDNPEDTRPGRNIPWPGAGKKVAVYDISAQRVYMPNGESMEAHSGQGRWRDNPSYVHMKMLGPTPPSTYRLTMRERRFHGVEALRMTPVNGVNPHGRVGLLTHSYLRRRPGDSAGCVAFKDYPRFLRAWKRGEVDHIVVVASRNKARVLTAKASPAFSRSR